jgi:hypothetical protein
MASLGAVMSELSARQAARLRRAVFRIRLLIGSVAAGTSAPSRWAPPDRQPATDAGSWRWPRWPGFGLPALVVGWLPAAPHVLVILTWSAAGSAPAPVADDHSGRAQRGSATIASTAMPSRDPERCHAPRSIASVLAVAALAGLAACSDGQVAGHPRDVDRRHRAGMPTDRLPASALPQVATGTADPATFTTEIETRTDRWFRHDLGVHGDRRRRHQAPPRSR